MSDAPKMQFEHNFLEVFLNAQREAERLEVKCISDILILKGLVYIPETYMSDLLQFSGVPWMRVKNVIEREVANWAKKARQANIHYLKQNGIDDVEKGSNEFDFVVDMNVASIINKASAYVFPDGFLGELAFCLGMLDDISENVASFFKEIRLDTVIVRRYFEGAFFEKAYDEFFSNNEDDERQIFGYYNQKEDTDQQEQEFEIPKNLQGLWKVVKAEVSDSSPILGREEETESLTKILLKAKKSNAILVGKPGVGKTAIVEDLAWRIKNGKCVEALKDKTILALTVNDIVAGTIYRGMAEERFKLVSDFLEKSENVILFIDEIHNVIGAGSTGNEDKQDLANALKPILAREGISVIGATTEEEYERIFRRDGAFKRRFEKVIIREPKANEVHAMVKEQVRRLSKFHGTSITSPVIDYIIKVSGCFIFETGNPDRTLDLIDKSMATAKLKGAKLVTREIVLENFDANFKLYSKMSEKYKLSIAYHETGHYLVARYGKHFPLNAMAVSIIPADDYLGVTVYDDEPVLMDRNYDFHLEDIARMLGGRVAEKMYSGTETSGACSDLEKATDAARRMIVEYGLSKEFALRNSDNDFYDEKSKKLNEEIDRIIGEAYKVAESILKEHEEILSEIAGELVKQGILIQDDLDRICKRMESKSVKITKPDIAEIQ